ncbi:MAG TPA: glycosyltransferase family 39 protein [Bdellovibrionota bacterium]|jgi:4-amino-4-deoxy-L-arabinose transferase-like glycosyltransferase
MPQQRKARYLAALALFFALAVCLTLAARGLGLCWDESIYFEYSDGLKRWAAAGFPWSQPVLEQVWHWKPQFNVHPPFMRVISALFSGVPLEYPLSYRFGHLLVAAGGLTLAFLLLSAEFSLIAALMAVLFVLLQPRLFVELLIGTTDGPTALFWLLLALLSWRIAGTKSKPERKKLWALLFLVQGMATATKFTGLLAAVPVVFFHLVRKDRRSVLLSLGSAACSLFFLVLFSPQNWAQPWVPVWETLSYPWRRSETINVATYYLGQLYGEHPPWHYVLVMTALTLPPLHLVCALFSPLASKKKKEGALLQALLPFLAAWLALGLSPSAPKHDGVRQFAALLPFLGLLAWLGAQEIAAVVAKRKYFRFKKPELLPAIPLTTALLGLLLVHPFEQAYYNSLIGGLKGAAGAGFEVFYDFAAVDKNALHWLNADLRPGSTVTIRPYWAFLLLDYQARGLLRPDVQVILEPQKAADFLVLVHRRSLVDRNVYDGIPAAYEVTHEGVSILKIAKRGRNKE